VGDTVGASAGDTVTYNVTAWSGSEYHQAWKVGLRMYQSNISPQYKLVTSTGQTVTDRSTNPFVQMSDRETATLTVTIPPDASQGDFTSLVMTSQTGTSEYSMWPVAIVVQ
jgi:hypothetical protein